MVNLAGFLSGCIMVSLTRSNNNLLRHEEHATSGSRFKPGDSLSSQNLPPIADHNILSDYKLAVISGASQEICNSYLSAIAHQYHDKLIHYISGRLTAGGHSDPHLAEDVVQDIFMNLPKRIVNYDSMRGTPTQFLYTSALNKMRDYLKANQHNPILSSQSIDAILEKVGDNIDLGEEKSWILQKKNNFSPTENEKEALNFVKGSKDPKMLTLLQYAQGENYEKIAASNDIAEGTARYRVHAARKIVRELFESRKE